MSLGEIEQALGGTAPLVMPIFGKVNGKDHFAANFEPREKLRTQGYGDHVLREWWSPEISIMVVTDTQDRVECIYSGGGQSPPGLVPAILNALRRALRL